MLVFILKRMVSLLLTLIAASFVIFFVIEILPGDPASFMLGLDATPEAVEIQRELMGLNRPLWERYVSWITGLVQGDFGTSFTYKVPVADLIADRIWVSLPLAAFALSMSILIAFPVGVIAAAKRNSIADVSIMGATQLGIAIPNFWFAMLLVLFFAIQNHWFSAGGFPGWDDGFWVGMKGLVLPAVSLALPQASILARVMRSSLLDTLDEDYIRTARAKGLSRRQALWRHALRNAMIPVLTIIGLQFSFLMAGSVIIEKVFFLPGIGSLVFLGITQRDLIVVKSVVMLLVFAVIVVTFLVDVAYAFVDPRLRKGR